MESEEIVIGKRYWVTHEGQEVEAKVRSRQRGQVWICELPASARVLMLPLSAFVRAAPST